MANIIHFLSFPFLQQALLSGFLLALAASLLGVFIVLRKMSFFSDAIAHASLAGVAIGLLFQIQPIIGAIGFSVFVGILLGILMKKKRISSDAIIGILLSSSIALAVVLIRKLPGAGVDLSSLLFGSILAVSMSEVILSFVVLALVLIFIKWAIKPMLLLVFNEDIAEIHHRKVTIVDYVFLGLLSLTVALSLEMIGAILVTALLIIPAATAQNISRNIKQLFAWSAIIATLSVVVGLYLSFAIELPSGATIVLVSTSFFIFSFFFKRS